MPSIYDSCLLFRVNIRVWNPKLTSKKASDEVTTSYGAENGAAKVVRALLPKDASNMISAMRNRILLDAHKYTLPYDDSSNRLCTPKAYDHIMVNYQDWERDFLKVKDEIVERYPLYRADAPNRLGGLYDPDEWPDQIASHFSIQPILQPLPKGDNIPNQFGAARYKEIQETTDYYVNERLNDAIKSNWGSIIETLHWFRDVLDETGKEKLNIRSDTLRRFEDQLNLYEMLNFSNDQRIADTIAACREQLFQYGIDSIRSAPQIRDYLKTRTNDVIDQMHAIWA